jgi:hypothetical protein
LTEREEDKSSIAPQDAPAKKRQRDVIGKELRRLFDDVASEPVPDDLMALMDKLEAKLDGQ